MLAAGWAGAAQGIAGGGCGGRCGSGSQPCAFSPGASREQSEALPGPWHPHRLCPCHAAPASRHRGDLQDLAVLRASSSIWPRYWPPHIPPPAPALPFLPPPAAPGSQPAGDTAQDDARGQLCLRSACARRRQSPSTRSIFQTPARASSALGLWGSIPGAGVSAGVCRAGGWRQCPGLVTSTRLSFPWEQGRAGHPRAHRLQLRCWHQQPESRGGWPQLT